MSPYYNKQNLSKLKYLEYNFVLSNFVLSNFEFKIVFFY